MEQKDKELLLIDLCARLPYGTKVRAFIGEKGENDEILDFVHIFNIYAYDCKPYLRLMSSMTKEEEDEWWEFENKNTITESHLYSLNWLNAHHFDYRGLIEKGLALEAPDGMYDKRIKV